MRYFPSSELVLNDKGQVYHLALSPDQLADTIILVGDQDRVDTVTSQFDAIEFRNQHREFVCSTGLYQGKRLTVLSTGIGTDNIDIVVNELDALCNIDLDTRKEKAIKRSLKLIRIGTCGILQADIPIHSYLLSAFAVGIDNVAHFYEVTPSASAALLQQAFQDQINLPVHIIPYAAEAAKELVNQFQSDLVYPGITVTSSGFYGPQGRSLRIPLQRNDLNESLSAFRFNDQRILNFEMESSALFALGSALGHQCVTLCLGIANRPANTFSEDYREAMNNMIRFVLDRV
jgi:uridine phosphorylase